MQTLFSLWRPLCKLSITGTEGWLHQRRHQYFYDLFLQKILSTLRLTILFIIDKNFIKNYNFWSLIREVRWFEKYKIPRYISHPYGPYRLGIDGQTPRFDGIVTLAAGYTSDTSYLGGRHQLPLFIRQYLPMTPATPIPNIRYFVLILSATNPNKLVRLIEHNLTYN